MIMRFARCPMVRAAAVHQVPDPQHDEHERDQELHPEPESRWHREPEGDDCAPEEHDRQGVPEPLQDANGHGCPQGLLPGDDGRDGGDVVGVGRVTHPQEGADRQHRCEIHGARQCSGDAQSD
jgi:hypothetical protein